MSPADSKLAEVEFTAWLREFAAFIQPELEARGISLAVEAAASLFVRADADQLRQVVLNLTRNAEEAFDGHPPRGVAQPAGGADDRAWHDGDGDRGDAPRGLRLYPETVRDGGPARDRCPGG